MASHFLSPSSCDCHPINRDFDYLRRGSGMEGIMTRRPSVAWHIICTSNVFGRTACRMYLYMQVSVYHTFARHHDNLSQRFSSPAKLHGMDSAEPEPYLHSIRLGRKECASYVKWMCQST
ncbi:hypothetical protein PV04_08091 [Phialophora macrospora]|uniref:Uncharacterized protein n=1 Tax=Phialophora macrospora TaxID=1851006 RepID=A0A0D2FGI1_9EURO|nr:hypothetical protein PV04_08091 [Phialophora macrospora]